MLSTLLHPLALLLLCSACAASAAAPSLPAARINAATCKPVSTGPGPHSLMLLPGAQRLLISSHDRRQFEKPGEIEELDISTLKKRVLARSGEPAGLVLRPHHFDLVSRGSETLLYLINHDEDSPNSREHSLLVYAVEADRLVFRQRLRDPLLSSPNHVSVAPDGDIYVSNDRRDGSSVLELALRQSKANVVHLRPSSGRGWEIVADGLRFPNGVKAEATRVLVPQTFGNALLSWPRLPDGRLGAKREVVKLPALDGINPGPEPDTWLLVSHGPLLDFLRHQNKPSHRSAGTVYLVHAGSGKHSVFFADDGSRISAMSNAVLAGGALYIGQSFDSFVLRCALP